MADEDDKWAGFGILSDEDADELREVVREVREGMNREMEARIESMKRDESDEE